MALCSTGLCPLNHGPRWHYMNYRTESSYNNLHPQKFQNFILCIFDRAFLYNPFQMKPITCTLLLSIFISTSLRVSGNYVPIIRRTYCIYATLVFVTLYGWVAGLQTRQQPFFFLWRCGPTRARASSFLRFSRSHTTTHHSR